MPVFVGLALALGVGVFGTWVGFDRDRAFYPTVLIVVASYYCLFAVMAGATSILPVEMAFLLLFGALAAVGFRLSLWLVVFGLAAHGVFDLIRGDLITNPGVPLWWPVWCLAYDVAAAAYLAWRLVSSSNAVNMQAQRG